MIENIILLVTAIYLLFLTASLEVPNLKSKVVYKFPLLLIALGVFYVLLSINNWIVIN